MTKTVLHYTEPWYHPAMVHRQLVVCDEIYNMRLFELRAR